MATWKKVVVSGSNISQLNNDAGYLTSNTLVLPKAFSTASFNGTNLLADSPSGSLTFASSSGQGLTISANAGIDTLTFGLSAIPNSSLQNSTISGIALGSNLADLTAGSGLSSAGTYTGATARTFTLDTGSTHFVQGARGTISVTDTTGASGIDLTYSSTTGVLSGTLVNSAVTVTAGSGLTGGGSLSLGGTTAVNVGAGTHITVNADDIAVNTATLIPAITGSILTGISGSIYTGVSGDITISSTGVATIAANSVALGTDTTGNYVATLGTGTGVTIGSNTGEGSTPTISVNYGSTANTAVQGNTNITLNGTSNEIEITGTAAQALGAGPTYTIGLPNNVTIGNNLTVTGDLYVNGTTTTINTSDLYVEDKFIILASGSATAGDGGIIIDRGSDVAGNIAFGFDSTTDRWGFQNGLTDATNAITIGTDGNSAFVGYVFTEATHTSAPTSGEFVAAGAIYTATSGDIFIYS